jgi:hypothetical protein
MTTQYAFFATRSHDAWLNRILLHNFKFSFATFDVEVSIMSSPTTGAFIWQDQELF